MTKKDSITRNNVGKDYISIVGTFGANEGKLCFIRCLAQRSVDDLVGCEYIATNRGQALRGHKLLKNAIFLHDQIMAG